MWARRLCQAFCVSALFALLAAAPAGAAVIAHWRFEPDAFTADSSPSGSHTLVNNGATSSTDVAGPEGGAGSASFDGGDWLQTNNKLDLSPYRHIRISWLMFKETDSTAIIYEHTANYNVTDGAFIAVANGDIYPGRNDRGYIALNTPDGDGVNVDYFPHATAPTLLAPQGVWEAFSAEIDLDAPSREEVIQIFDGNGNVIGTTDPTFSGTTAAALLNDIFAIGARSGGGAGFVGNIDEVMIEAVEVVPEPTGVALLGLGLGFIATRRRRGA